MEAAIIAPPAPAQLAEPLLDDSEGEEDERDADFLDMEDDLEFSSAAAVECDRFRDLAARYAHRVNLDSREGRRRDKSDRATTERALDPAVLRVLYKLLEQGRIKNISGCISTGKEANVYHAESGDGKEVALKIYMTAIQQFRRRAEYLEGDWRMRNTRYTGSSRRRVGEWAHKELMNLRRIRRFGEDGVVMPCPEPLLLKGVVLLMEFVGEDGVAAPRLRDATWTDAEAADAYRQSALLMRRMYQRARLVHADCNEYNLLWHRGRVVVIDVSQSVECERHPRALHYLRHDTAHVTLFFGKQRGVRPVLSARRLFDFVTDPRLPSVDDAAEAACLERLLDAMATLDDEELVDSGFLEVYVVRRLDEVNVDDRRVRARLRTTDTGQLLASVTGTGLAGCGEAAENSDSSSSCLEEVSEGEEEGEEDEEGGSSTKPVKSESAIGRPREESPESRRMRKAAVKEAAKLKRQIKMPKHEKRRKEKTTRHKKC